MEKEERFGRVESLALHLMSEVGKVIPVLPVSLVATVFLRHPGNRISGLELKAEAYRLIRILKESGARLYVPRKDQDYAIEVGLRMLTLRRLVEETDGLFLAVPGELPVLRYYANAIRHLLPEDLPSDDAVPG
jgi:glycerol-3-phosphate O-acyltransferase